MIPCCNLYGTRYVIHLWAILLKNLLYRPDFFLWLHLLVLLLLLTFHPIFKKKKSFLAVRTNPNSKPLKSWALTELSSGMFWSTATLPLGRSTLVSLVITHQSGDLVTLATPAPLHWCLDPCHPEAHLWLDLFWWGMLLPIKDCVPSINNNNKPTIRLVHPITPVWGGRSTEAVVTNLYWLEIKGGLKAMKTAACRKRSAQTVRRSVCACCWALSTVQAPLAGEHQCPVLSPSPAPCLCSSSHPLQGRLGVALGS